jgi:hypothetical protein
VTARFRVREAMIAVRAREPERFLAREETIAVPARGRERSLARATIAARCCAAANCRGLAKDPIDGFRVARPIRAVRIAGAIGCRNVEAPRQTALEFLYLYRG